MAGSCLLATEQPAGKRQDLFTGSYTEGARLLIDVPNALQESRPKRRETVHQMIYSSDCNSIPPQAEEAIRSVG